MTSRSQNEWRPIESAPKDGTAILAGSIHHECSEVVCWQDGEPSGSQLVEGDPAPEEGWVNAGTLKDRFYANPRWFTHWMPLPQPPAESGAAGRQGSVRSARGSKSTYERVQDRIAIDPATQCHNYTGRLDRRGYGQVSAPGGRRLTTHKVAYEAVRGPVPTGKVLDHLCRNTRCCNPDHLEAVTHRENVLRGISPPAIRAASTHCVHGHEFTAANTYLDKKSQRHCRACRQARQQARRARLRTNGGKS